MRKKFTLEITSPCSENFDKMIPNSNGSFCNSCMKNVIDLSQKTNSEVAKFISENKDKNICARLKTVQLEEEFQYNETSKINTLKYAAVAASILLVSNVSGQEKEPIKTEINNPKPIDYRVGRVAFSQTENQEISIIIKGKLLNAKTNRPFDLNNFPNLMLTINDSESTIKMSSSGDFLIPVKVLKDSKTLSITITANDYYLSKTIPFDVKSVKKSILSQNIVIAEEELSKVVIMGGLGVNYIPEK
ncbi:hypothetical protein J0383_05805 [Flavobacterium endoglycinae]|uniref:Uncharacterized protein n=1 Tax=Flavobacterium endoglycinae TaxID=2816357 RepID=A0ABX7QI71_9FLAO|nr:hypothetical protein [Flavobacterium endoglycinae]QSW90329.1 hypothetical protein J0383_05805 [Flavobacterium endoglycinae]